MAAENIGLAEEQERGNIHWNVYFTYWKAVGPYLATVVLVAALLMQASRNVSDWWLSYWVSQPMGNTTETTIFHVYVYGGIAAANSVFTLIRSFLFAYGGICAAMALHQKILTVVLQAKTSFFDNTAIGRIVNRFSSDVSGVDDSLPFNLNIFLAQSYSLGGTVIMMCYGIPWILILLLPLTVVYYLIQRYYRRTSRELKRITSITLSPVYAHFSETLRGLVTIRALRESECFQIESDEYIQQNLKARFSGLAASQWLNMRLQFIGVTLVTGVALIAVLQHSYSFANPGLVGLSLSYALAITNLLNGLVTSFAQTEKEMVAVERVNQYINDIEPERKDGIIKPPYSWPAQGVILFKNVTLQYRENMAPALDDISFESHPFEKIGIVGRTGAGKSSLLQVLFRIVDSYTGCIEIDSVDIKTIGLKALRSRMAVIPQDPFLFSGTVKENLDPKNVFSDSDLMAALQRCQMAGVVVQMGGLNTEVGERGSVFSAGQKQLICLTRALLHNAKILCIDEGTANVDHATDVHIQQTIRKSFLHSTVLTIAHRITTILDSHRVMVMANGKLVEFDTPKKLLKNTKSQFYNLVNNSMQVMKKRTTLRSYCTISPVVHSSR